MHETSDRSISISFPRIDRASADVRLAEENGLSLDAYRFETLDPLYELAKRIRIPEAA